MRRSLLIFALVIAVVHPLDSWGQDEPGAGENPLAPFATLLGAWAVPRAVVEERPELRGRITHDYAWTVGENAMRVRENYAAGNRETSEVDGILYWHPGTNKIEFTAVGGRGPTQGRVFHGEYRLLSDDRIERIYDVHYRTLADTPGEELGGNVRRYREVYRIEGDALTATLDWWRDGEWKPFGPGTYALERVRG